MPKSLDDSLAALEKDATLKEALAEGLVELYVTIKRAEQKMLEELFSQDKGLSREKKRGTPASLVHREVLRCLV